MTAAIAGDIFAIYEMETKLGKSPDRSPNILSTCVIPDFDWPPPSLAKLSFRNSHGVKVIVSQKPDESNQDFFDRYISEKYADTPQLAEITYEKSGGEKITVSQNHGEDIESFFDRDRYTAEACQASPPPAPTFKVSIQSTPQPSAQDFAQQKENLSNTIGQNVVRAKNQGGNTSVIFGDATEGAVGRLAFERGYIWANRVRAIRDMIVEIQSDLMNIDDDGNPKLGTISPGDDPTKKNGYAKSSFDQWRRRTKIVLDKLGSREEKIKFCKEISYRLYSNWCRPNLLGVEEEKVYKDDYLKASIAIGEEASKYGVIVADQIFYDREKIIMTPGQIKDQFGEEAAQNRFSTRIFANDVPAIPPGEAQCRYSFEPKLAKAARLCELLFTFVYEQLVESKQMVRMNRVDGGVIYGRRTPEFRQAVEASFGEKNQDPPHQRWAAPPSMSYAGESLAYSENHHRTSGSHGINRAGLISQFVAELLFTIPEGETLSPKEEQRMMDKILIRHGYNPDDPSKVLDKVDSEMVENKFMVAKQMAFDLLASLDNIDDLEASNYAMQWFSSLFSEIQERDCSSIELLQTLFSTALQKNDSFETNMLEVLGQVLIGNLQQNSGFLTHEDIINLFVEPDEAGINGVCKALTLKNDEGENTLLILCNILAYAAKIKNQWFTKQDGILELFGQQVMIEGVYVSGPCVALLQRNVQALEALRLLLTQTLAPKDRTIDNIGNLFMPPDMLGIALDNIESLPNDEYESLMGVFVEIFGMTRREGQSVEDYVALFRTHPVGQIILQRN
jgi:hypothetical protein